MEPVRLTRLTATGTAAATAAVSALALSGPLPAPSSDSDRQLPRLASATTPSRLPTPAEVGRAAARVDAMSLPELAGQVIVASYRGTAAPVRLVRRLHLGGVIVFSENVTSTTQIRRSNATLARQVRRPLLVGVDQEGGAVARVTGAATRFPAFMSAGAADDPALTRAAAAGSGSELVGLGFDSVFAPVADVTVGAADPTIGARSAGSRAGLVSRQVVAAGQGFQDSGVVPVLKHFPGHGSLTADSHRELPVQRRSRATLDRIDLRPFREAVLADAPAVMTGHIDVRAVDPGRPASVSYRVTTGLLRRELGFRGVVITDSLAMAGVRRQYPGGRGAVAALRAGADVLLMPQDPVEARVAIVRAVRDGRLSRARLEEAATRMLAMLLHRDAGARTPAAPGSRRASSVRLSRAALTSVAGPCSGRLLGRSIRVVGPEPQAARLRAAARRAGLGVGSGSSVVLLPRGAKPARGAVAVALDTPYVLGRSRARVKLATYGDNDAVLRNVVALLLGRTTAPGRLPVPVRGVPRTGC